MPAAIHPLCGCTTRRGEADLAPFAELNADPEVAGLLGGAPRRDESDRLAIRIAARWRSDGVGLGTGGGSGVG